MYRHCVRSTSGTTVKAANPDYVDGSSYTDLPLPDWNTPAKWCTGQGAKLIESEGKQLREENHKMDMSLLKVFVDTDQRDATTANSLLTGLADKDGIYVSKVEYFPLLFNANEPNYGKGVCDAADGQLVSAQKQRRLDTTPMPMGIGLAGDMNQTRYTEVLELMESFIGIGAAGPLTDLASPPYLNKTNGQLTGAPGVMKLFAQNLLYAYASGIPYKTHAPASREQIYQLSSWIYWYRQINEIPAVLVPEKACGVLSIIMTLLDTSKRRNVIYVGHDSDLDALAHFFQLRWKAPPFPGPRPTPPGSSLVFSPNSDGTALVHFAYQDFDSTDDSEVKVVPAIPCRVDLHEAQAFIEKQIIQLAGRGCLKGCRRTLSRFRV
ncbi:ANKRD17 [Symbiodinium natans]|uniref:ANKRD17 protein n=1 Tax=Symbiodinium natans TaxID=878477 RepID=A0A812KAI3_9DINO|nr:ANKRD17 [Symbiodinium natans]